MITNTLYNHHKRNRYTWISPDGQTRNQINYILINQQMKTSVLDSKARPGADADSDHNLVIAKVRLKAHKQRVKQPVKKFAVEKLEVDEIRRAYIAETENRFKVLLDTITEEQTPNELLGSMEHIWKESAEKVVGFKRRKKEKPWISEEALELADDEETSKIEASK